MTLALAKAVFLDRDGVLNIPEFRNGRSYAPTRFSDFSLYPETPAALIELKNAGFLLVVVTNQPDVAYGKLKGADLDLMHAKLQMETCVDAIYACRHGKDENCKCRKPNIGMLKKASKELGINLNSSYMVGDRLGDMVAGEKAGCKTVFIDRGYTNDPLPEKYSFRCGNIMEAANWIVTGSK